MSVLRDPFFWASISMFGLLAGTAAVSGAKLGRHALLGFIIVLMGDLPRLAIALPFCPQPRFDIGV
jgi:hypothetical protein